MREPGVTKPWHAVFRVGILLCAVAAVAFLMVRNPNVGTDSLGYLISSGNALRGEGYMLNGKTNVLSSPGYGFAAHGLRVVVRALEWSGMLLSAIGYVGMVALAYSVCTALAGPVAGVVGSFMMAVSPLLLSYSYASLSDPFFAFIHFATFCFFLGVDARGWSVRKAGVLGGLLGLGCLVRPDSVFVLLVSAFYLLVRAAVLSWKDRTKRFAKEFLRQGIVPMAACLAVFFIVMSPYMIFLHRHTGVWTVSNKIGFGLMGGGQENPHLTLDATRNAVGLLLSDIEATSGRMLRNGLMLVHQVILQNHHLLFPLGGLWVLYPLFGRRRLVDEMKRHPWWRLPVGASIFISPLAPGTLITPYNRYMLPYFAVLIVFLSVVLVRLLRGYGIREGHSREEVASVVVVMLVALAAPLAPRPAALRPLPTPLSALRARHGHLGLRAAGCWIGEHVEENEEPVIVSHKAAIPIFYIGDKRGLRGTALPLPPTPEGLQETFGKGPVDYVVLDAYYAARMPGYAEIWRNPASAGGYGLRLVRTEPGRYQLYVPLCQ